MPLSAGTLDPDIQAAVYAELQVQFASDIAGLSSGQQTRIKAEWLKIATAVGKGGTPVVAHIESDAVVTVTGVTPGSGSATGTVA